MEKVTLTKLYDVLAQKVGRNEAECLTQYVELKVKDELNTKTEILATKVFVKDECQKLRDEIHGLRNEMKGEIHGLRNEIKGEIHDLRSEMKGEIHGLHTEMKDSSISLKNWMFATIITLVTMMMGLYAAFLLRH